MSAAAAISATDPAFRALVPASAASNAAAFMSKAITSPAYLVATLRHMAPPITPRPMKPMTGGVCVVMRSPQSIHMPPLMSSDVPVIQLDAGEHRNSAACAMSSAFP